MHTGLWNFLAEHLNPTNSVLQVLKRLFQAELKQDRDREYWLTVYYVEPSHCNVCGNLNGLGT